MSSLKRAGVEDSLHVGKVQRTKARNMEGREAISPKCKKVNVVQYSRYEERKYIRSKSSLANMHDYLCKNVWIKREKEESFLFFSLSVSAHIFDVDDWWCGCEYPSGLEDQGLNLLDILDLPSLPYFPS